MNDATKTIHARDSIKHAVVLLEEVDRNSLYEYHGDLWPEYWETLLILRRALFRANKLSDSLEKNMEANNG